MAGSGEPLGLVMARIARGDVPAILVTRFDAERGEDLFGRDGLVRRLTEAVLGNSSPLFGQSRIDAPVVALAEVLDAAREVSLLAPKRLVLVRGSRLAASGAAEPEGDEAEALEGDEGRDGSRSSAGAESAQIAFLERYLKQAASAACIAFVGCPWDARRRIHKAVLAAATIVDVGRPDPRHVPRWIEERVAEGGGRIAPEATRLLAELRGNDTLRLAGEIEKLLLHRGREECIVEADVAALVGAGEGASAWTLVDAMASGDSAGAVRALRRLLDEGVPVPMIVGALASRLRQLVVLCDETSQRRPHEEARRLVFPGRSIVFADSLARQARRFAPENLLAALASLYEVDKLSKSGSLDPGALLEPWLLSIARRSAFVRSPR